MKVRSVAAAVAARARAFGAGVADLGAVPVTLALTVIGLLALYFGLLGSIQPEKAGTEVSLDRVEQLIEQRRVASAVLYDEDARVALRTVSGEKVFAAYPKSDAATADIIDSLRDADVRVTVDQQTGKARTRFIVQFLLPLVILAALFGLVFVVLAAKGGANAFAAFSRMKRRDAAGLGSVTFADVAACEEAIIELREVVDFLREPERYAAIGARSPKGVLLSGPPGTGKTLLARAVAGEAGVRFFSLSGSDFVESLVGVGAARVRDLFRQAREAAPAIIFIDELDAAGRQRGAGMGQGNDEREQTLNQILVEMDGFSAAAGIVVLGATNRPDILDPALLRPGRFDRQVVVDAPDARGREQILRLYADARPLEQDVDVARIARQTPGFTGAELANVVNEAALVAVRSGRSLISTHDLEEAVDRVVAGPERRSHVLTPEEKRLVAYHEAGHAVVAAGIGMEAGVQKLSIVARGRSLGHTTTYQVSDRLVLTEAELFNRLVVHLAGAAVEQLVFGQLTTGSEGDLRAATDIARSMVATFGMTDAIGRVAVAQKAGEVFLGRDVAKMQEVAPATLEVVDQEVRALLDRAEDVARALVVSHRRVVDAVAGALIEHETLSGPPLAALLAPVGVPGNGNGNGSGASSPARRRKTTAST